MFHAIVDQLGRQGHVDPKVYADIKTARMNWKSRKGEEAFKAYEEQLVISFIQLLTNLDVQEYNQAVERVFQKYKDQVYRYTRRLIRDLKDQDYLLFAVSGSGHDIVGKIARYYDFDDFIGSEYEQKDGRFTGQVASAIYQKPQLLKQLVAKHNLTFAGSIGVGDSEGDIDMLSLAEQPIAFNPSKKLFRHASTNGWKIVLERKNMVYELEQADGSYRLARTNAQDEDA
jgi:HAD superfamily phosphoserine phosphatase-like hydrolase